VYNSS